MGDLLRQPRCIGIIVLGVLIVAGIIGIIAYLATANGAPQLDSALLERLKGDCKGAGGTLADTNDDFSARFYVTIAAISDANRNLIMSPLSALTVTAMASLGAKGETLRELRNALSLPCSEEATLTGFRDFITALDRQVTNNYSLTLANRMFLDRDYRIDSDFRSKCERNFLASPESIDFDDSEIAAARINTWVENQTGGKIKDLIQPGALHAAVKLVMVNAVYFKGSWQEPFSELLTDKAPFYGVQGTKDVMMMQLESDFYHGQFQGLMNAHVVKLPYLGNRIAMYIILPTADTSIYEVEQKLLDFDLDEQLRESRLKLETVALKIPKFKLQTEMELTEVFRHLGAEEMFVPGQADFTGILQSSSSDTVEWDSSRLHVDEIIQKAFVEVNEKGTEAAAATGINFRTTSLRDPVEFRCDRPFLYLIRDDVSRMTLFVGRLVQPDRDV